jgi:hypothetical protein
MAILSPKPVDNLWITSISSTPLFNLLVDNGNFFPEHQKIFQQTVEFQQNVEV